MHIYVISRQKDRRSDGYKWCSEFRSPIEVVTLFYSVSTRTRLQILMKWVKSICISLCSVFYMPIPITYKKKQYAIVIFKLFNVFVFHSCMVVCCWKLDVSVEYKKKQDQYEYDVNTIFACVYVNLIFDLDSHVVISVACEMEANDITEHQSVRKAQRNEQSRYTHKSSGLTRTYQRN